MGSPGPDVGTDGSNDVVLELVIVMEVDVEVVEVEIVGVCPAVGVPAAITEAALSTASHRFLAALFIPPWS
jgi:hypothetical protein